MILMRFPGGLSKALTLSYDDGVEQDATLIGILNQYGLKATFNLNSGCFAPEGTTYPKGQIHRRMSTSQVKALYAGSGHEVAVHCLTHASLTELSQPQMIREIIKDRENLESLFGCIVRGMAYPFGTFNDQAVEALRACGIAYARTVISSRRFDLPKDWLRLEATCHHDDPQLMALADSFLVDHAVWGSRLFYLWGHAYEFEANNNWDVIRAFAEKMGGRDDIWYATNIEIYDYVQAYQSLHFSADNTIIHNPSAQTLWLEKDGKLLSVAPGETIHCE